MSTNMNSGVKITEGMLTAALPIFYVTRFLGLAPMTYEKSERRYRVNFSLTYSVISYIFGGVMVYGMVSDLEAGSKSLRMTSTKTAIITMSEIFIVSFIVSLGIFGAPFRLKFIWEFLSLLKQADEILKLSDYHRAQRNSKTLIGFILVATLTLIISNLILEDRTDDGYYAVKNYLAFYFLYVIVFMIECQYRQLVYAVERRYKRLNECLRLENVPRRNTGQNRTKLINLYFNELAPNKYNRLDMDYIARMSQAHGHLCQAVQVINDGFGFMALVVVTSCLFHLVVTPYFLLLDLLEKSANPVANLILQFFWVLTHVCRLLLVIQPCHTACEEAQNTNPLVSQLLCSDVDEYQRKQIWGTYNPISYCNENCVQDKNLHKKTFYIIKFALIVSISLSLQLLHRQIEFSAYGLCSIDRPLLSTIAGAITTYLVILLQFH